MKVALIVGHSENYQGAFNKKYMISEYMFNNLLISFIIDNIEHYIDREEIEIIKVFRTSNYKDLINDLNKNNFDFFISFHCNAYNEKVFGCETLYYENSIKSRSIANIVQKKLIKIGLKNRNIKGIDEKHRGGYLLVNTKMPGVITEPFFIDNNEDFKFGMINIQKLVNEYTYAILDIIGEIDEY